MNWFKKLLQPKHQKQDKNNTLEQDINELIDFLVSQVTNFEKGKSLLDEASELRKSKLNRKIFDLPSFYLSFEHFLTKIDDNKSFSVEILRYNVGNEFPTLLEVASFNIIFQSTAIQEVTLCKFFLINVLDSFLEIFGEKNKTWFTETKLWLQSIPKVKNTEKLPPNYNSEAAFFEEWNPLLKSVSHLISENIEEKVGEKLIYSIFEKNYNKIANAYKYLEGFPAVVAIIPERFLNSEKIGILSKHQISKILLGKNNRLEILNKQLADKNLMLISTKEALLESNKKLEATLLQFSTVLNTVNEGIITANVNGEIVMINRMIQEMFGFTEAELLGKPLTMIMPEKYKKRDGKGVENYIETAILKMLNKPTQLEGKSKDGHIFPVEVNISKGKINDRIIFTAAIKDITARVAMEKALLESNERLEIKVKERTEQLTITQLELKALINDLERSNKELEEFGYMVSHDLQEPLRTISSYLQLLKKRFPDDLDTTANEFLSFAVDGSVRMKRLIYDLLEYSRAGRGGACVQLVAVKEIEATLKNMFNVRLEETSGTLIFKGIATLIADESQLTQLFQNLISNALKFQKPNNKPIIEVEITEAEKEWLIAVKDNGIGIDETFQERIFQVFQRLHSRDEYKGTGIGLAICKKIVDAHNGKIWIKSELGTGTIFFFTISKDI